jgi:tetratricopeptide (TPR) repeat protein
VFTPEQLPDLKAKRFSFQDAFPLISGSFRFDVLIKNTISKEFTSIEKNITIPQSQPTLQMSSIILAHKVRRFESQNNSNRAFQFKNIQLYPPAQKNFTTRDRLFVYFQIFGLTEELKNNGTIKFTVLREDEKTHILTKKITEYEEKTGILQEFSLADYPPGYYAINISLLDKDMNRILSRREDFLVTSMSSLPRAWSLSEVIPPSDDPLHSYILGNQFFNKGDVEKARILLEKAYLEEPESLKYVLGFSKVIFVLQDYQKIKDILSPFLGEADKEEGIYFYLGKSSQMLGHYEEAISYYKEYLSHFGTHLGILNSIGDCYHKMGNEKEAIRTWEKSLEIDPKQKEIRKIIASLKKKQAYQN